MASDDNDLNDLAQPTEDSYDNFAPPVSKHAVTNTIPYAPVKDSTPNVDMNFNFNPQMPYNVDGRDVPTNDSLGNAAPPEQPGFFRSALTEAESLSPTYQGLHALYNFAAEPDPIQDPHSPDWNPKSNLENFVNVRDENLPYLLAATGPKDQEFRYQRILSDQKDA